MPEPSPSSGAASPGLCPPAQAKEIPSRVFLVAYPKIVFLYPAFLASIVTAIYMSFSREPIESHNEGAVVVAVAFLAILAINFVILAFDFPRTTSLTLFFFAVAVVTAFVLLLTLKPELLPAITKVLAKFRPLANATFYWAFAGMLALIFLGVSIVVRFDYWEVRPNELLHHHGFLSNLERLSAESTHRQGNQRRVRVHVVAVRAADPAGQQRAPRDRLGQRAAYRAEGGSHYPHARGIAGAGPLRLGRIVELRFTWMGFYGWHALTTGYPLGGGG